MFWKYLTFTGCLDKPSLGTSVKFFLAIQLSEECMASILAACLLCTPLVTEMPEQGMWYICSFSATSSMAQLAGPGEETDLLPLNPAPAPAPLQTPLPLMWSAANTSGELNLTVQEAVNIFLLVWEPRKLKKETRVQHHPFQPSSTMTSLLMWHLHSGCQQGQAFASTGIPPILFSLILGQKAPKKCWRWL